MEINAPRSNWRGMLKTAQSNIYTLSAQINFVARKLTVPDEIHFEQKKITVNNTGN